MKFDEKLWKDLYITLGAIQQSRKSVGGGGKEGVGLKIITWCYLGEERGMKNIRKILEDFGWNIA